MLNTTALSFNQLRPLALLLPLTPLLLCVSVANAQDEEPDETPPTIVSFTGPASVSDLEPFEVTVTFNNPIMVNAATLDVMNGTSGPGRTSGNTFMVTITPDGMGHILITVPAGTVEDMRTLTVRYIPVDTAALITDFMLNRSNQLTSNQPGISRFLQADGCADVSANGTATEGGTNTGNVAACASTKHAWGDINRTWSDDGSYTLISVGGHGFVQPNTIVGGMLQLDKADDDTPNISGKGWLSGPYFVHKLNQKNMIFEGRLLYGQTDNDISPLGTYTDSFDTERYLAQLRITGEYGYQTATLMPLVDFTYTEDTLNAYTNTPDDLIEGHNTDLTQMTFGLDFKLPLAVRAGSLDLTGGVSGIYSETNGGVGDNSEPTFEGARARTELGLNYGSEDGPIVRAGTFYDGISTDYESYGLSISVGKEF